MKKTKVNIAKLTTEDTGRAVLQDKKGLREFGIITSFDDKGVYVLFGMNNGPLLMRGDDIYFINV
tara:strand:+ start:983 stop:1177 length:195 start_codon:yes stop_codon:yes gene_type:complete